MTVDFTTEDVVRSVSIDELTKRYRDVERFVALCRECPKFGRSWACPPFDFDTDDWIGRWENALVVATKIRPDRNDMPAEYASVLIEKARERIDARMLELECATGGRSFTFAGSCRHCAQGNCARLNGAQCRHPELVRPSLEAFGFDVCGIAAELCGVPLMWPSHGVLPDYMTLVTALFHNFPVHDVVWDATVGLRSE